MAKGATSTVLLVDDDPDVLAMTGMVLSGAGYSVIEAANATDALTVLEAHPEVALLFTDIVMPGLNGFELAEQAKRMRPELPVIYVSGHLANLTLADKHGTFIGKPWKGEHMLRMVRHLMGFPTRN